ncbi:MAG: diacylglyceryl transferase [Rickettsiales bacterium]|nr:diacylglyceryl transferase [Rickettsiales bacterium]
MKKIQKFFKVESFSRLVVIFTVFAITGSLSVYLGKYVILFFLSENLEKNFFYWSIRVLIIFPLYQILLIFVGTIFGEFKYFWEMEKKILKRFGLLKS